jgi:hypothetical protein
LTKDEVIAESKLLNAVPTHGTKAANVLNENIEYSMGVGYKNDDHLRWKNKYRITLEELRNYAF